MRASLILVAAVLTLIGGRCFAQDLVRPNIILIVADDLGYGDIGPYGQAIIPTPNLDALAETGVRFTDFYAGSSICPPSRKSLFTGQARRLDPSSYLLSEADETFGEPLQRAGYATAAIGKWGLGMPQTAGDPARHGFPWSFGFPLHGQSYIHYPDQMWRDGQVVSYPNNHRTVGDTFSDRAFVDDAIKFMTANKDRPFLLYLPLTLPHADILAPDSYMARWAGAFPEPNPFPGGHFAPQPTPRAAYAAMVTMLDELVGEIVGATQKLGLTERTLIIFTSDNGPVDVAGRDIEFFNSTGGLRGKKRDLYEGGIRVPLIVSMPGTIPSGGVTSTPAFFADIYPTFMDIAGATGKSDVDGRSIWPEMKNLTSISDQRLLYWFLEERMLVGDDPGNPNNLGAVRTMEAARFGKWKAVRPDSGLPLELYDMQSDSAETTDLADQNTDIVKTMEEKMAVAGRR